MTDTQHALLQAQSIYRIESSPRQQLVLVVVEVLIPVFRAGE